uniref:Vacuolar protein sorting-associated protein 33B-like n=1 Tax=Saccoglossus kowalevskii TaxID=10224 RepID=A0ABM0ME95_SACKO|nr:PREDICTED: vacuolar protein sorting-associated protein 33B-like [Saccoglossus kowalevskii]
MLRQIARDQLVHLLEVLSGRKDLVIDPELMRPLDRIAGASLLKQHGVDKIFKLEANRLQVGCDQRIYLVRPRMTTMKLIADHINSDKHESRSRKYKIILVPRKLYVCEMILEQEGVYGDVTFEEFHLDLIPLDRDILSLELPEFFPAYFMHGDQTWLHTVATSLVTIQSLFGTIPNVHGQGRCAKMVEDMMKLIQERQGELKSALNNEIGHLILLDRDIDYVTPLCSTVTYEGLLDEIFGIKSGFCEFDKDVTGSDKSTRLLLNCEDNIFEQIRNRHFSNVFEFLSSKAKALQVGFNKRHTLDSVGAMKSFVANDLRGLKQQHKSLAIHIGACEVIMKKKIAMDFERHMKAEHNLLEGVDLKDCHGYIEELICRQFLINIPLKLLCLMSLTQGGLPPKDHKFFKTLFLQSHGYEHTINFSKLKKLGIFVEQQQTGESNIIVDKVTSLQKKSFFKAVSKKLALSHGYEHTISFSKLKKLGIFVEQQQTGESNIIVDKVTSLQKKSFFKAVSKKLALVPKIDDYDVKNPEDMGYVFSGAYTPISCRLVDELLIRGGWSGLEDITKLFPGLTFSHMKAKSAKSKGTSDSLSNKVVLVYFLGGCTFAEIAALRLLGNRKGYRFIVATTAIINGNTLIDSIIDKFDNK